MDIKDIKCCGKPVIGQCEHSYSCSVCGIGAGCAPDPCYKEPSYISTTTESTGFVYCDTPIDHSSNITFHSRVFF